MGYWLCALLWGWVLLEEIQQMPTREWRDEGLKRVLLLRRTKNRAAYFLALIVGALFLYIETSIVLAGQSTFDFYQIVAMASVVWGGYLAVLYMKGRR